MSTVELDKIIKTRAGTPMVDGETGNPATVRNLALVTVDTQIQGDDAPGMKNRLIALGRKLCEANPDFTAKEVSLIVERAQKIHNARDADQLISAFDPAELGETKPAAADED